ncbi:MAG: AMP-binding protein [Alphaproteobacteria bacterium]|nr:AMP-binding protein [Alphaproteobacteria bacterium]MDP6831179.1 AMP-binding protein [Alphaproteobacteria bacterium]
MADKPRARTAPALLEEMAARQPGHESVVDGDRRWSYAELLAESKSIANGLWALGVRPGDRVAILMGNRAEWLSGYFAILGLGATAVALNTWLTPPEQAYQLNHAQVTTLILADRFRDRDVLAELEEMRALGLPSLRRLVVLGGRVPDGATAFADLAAMGAAAPAGIWSTAKPDDVACILYTSGSTARPKGVPLQHWGLIDNMWQIGERMHLSPDDRLWFAVSLFWSFGCVNALFAMLSHGGTMVLQHHFEAGEALRLIEAEGCTVFYGTPNIALALAEHPARAKHDLTSLRTGAAIGTPEQMQMIVDLGAEEICNVYGLTEAYGNSAVTDAHAPLARRLTASGAPLGGVEMRILDLESGQPLPQGEVGEIALRGHVMPGYLHDPDTTAASMTEDGFFLTGDLGLLDQHGWLQFQGRRKELIKSGGINIAPAEIEAVLRQHDAIESVFVTGLDDARLDQAIGAVIILHPGASVNEDDLRQYCRRSLAAYKVPHRFVFVAANELPVTSTEKLQRNRLYELFPATEG